MSVCVSMSGLLAAVTLSVNTQFGGSIACALFAVSVIQIQGALLHLDLLRCLPKKRIFLAPTVYPASLFFLYSPYSWALGASCLASVLYVVSLLPLAPCFGVFREALRPVAELLQ